MQTNEMTIPAVLRTRMMLDRVEVNVLTIIGASLLIALAAQIAMPLPFTPVPLTMQPLAVLLVGVTLGSRRGAAAAALYLLEGASGLPFFAQGNAGAVWLVAATAGYLWSYPLAAFVAGWFSERGWGSTTLRAIAGMLAALAIIYAGGFAWLAILTSPRAALTLGIVPFVVADIVKVALGAALLPQLQKLVSRLA
jgi:biotin transport system substrate-specific component